MKSKKSTSKERQEALRRRTKRCDNFRPKDKKHKTARWMSLEQFVDTFVEGMLREEEARQFDHQLTPTDKEEMKSIGIARVAADDVETLSGTTRSEEAEAGVKAEEWKPGRPVRIWKLG